MSRETKLTLTAVAIVGSALAAAGIHFNGIIPLKAMFYAQCPAAGKEFSVDGATYEFRISEGSPTSPFYNRNYAERARVLYANGLVYSDRETFAPARLVKNYAANGNYRPCRGPDELKCSDVTMSITSPYFGGIDEVIMFGNARFTVSHSYASASDVRTFGEYYSGKMKSDGMRFELWRSESHVRRMDNQSRLLALHVFDNIVQNCEI